METHSAAKQRQRMLEFAAALGSADTALRRDECGDWRINGQWGWIYAVPEGFQMYVVAGTKRAWTYAKIALDFAKVTQDSDDEGMLLLDRMPTADESHMIRTYIGVRKRPEFSPEVEAAARDRMVEFHAKRREAS